MAQSTFSLSWEAHRSNICNGLSVLQQNEEFVDMTLAADGHFVKVHQMVMALASPYFKDLISSAAGRHPVIYLNKTSHSTLCAILEYIYTGEVMISINNLSDLIQTAKDLHIKGLEDMKLQNSLKSMVAPSGTQAEEQCQESPTDNSRHSEIDDEVCYFEVTDRDDTHSQKSYSAVSLDDGILEDSVRLVDTSEMDEKYEEISILEEDIESSSIKKYSVTSEASGGIFPTTPTTMQYTVSNQGSIQMILNRYMYYLKHSNRNNSRQWRCVDYLNKSKCPAIVMTRNNVVKQRIAAHIHSHHDRRILKKVQAGAVYAAIHDAEIQGNEIKSKVRQEKMEKETPNPALQTESV